MNQRLFVVASIIGSIIGIDQLTKYLALNGCFAPKLISPFLYCNLTFNRGISWGILHDSNHQVFALVTAVIVVITVYLAYVGVQQVRAGKLGIGYACVVAGSFANLIDRFLYGAVIDFILFSYKGWHFPIFNVADIFIVLGVFLIAWQTWRD